MVGLAALRRDLRIARRRAATRDAIERLANATDGLGESPGLADARTALAVAEQALAKARQEHDRLDQLATI